MSVERTLDDILHAQKNGQPRGIASLCTAHPYVLRAAMQRARQSGAAVLIESTCNQVNQYGGYTGMKPADFVAMVQGIAAENGVRPEQLLLGGDHLGPNVWQGETAESAMAKSRQLVREYVAAGYRKIHLDASMRLADDNPQRPLPVAVSAARAADLAAAAEQAWQAASGPAPRYIIGSEVPIPGGAQEHEDHVAATSTASAQETITATRQAFARRGLAAAWERVVALVVQPGVEFGDDFVVEYAPSAARELTRFIEGYDLIYEAHSTDYQTRQGLADLVRDHFAILKVGPWLTFAFREAVFALARMEEEMLAQVRTFERSRLVETIDDVMVHEPQYWARYYAGNEYELRFARKFSLSDRVRYYWPHPCIQAALEQLLRNLAAAPIPFSLLSQYAPAQYERIRAGGLENTPHAIILDKIEEVLDAYAAACNR